MQVVAMLRRRAKLTDQGARQRPPVRSGFLSSLTPAVRIWLSPTSHPPRTRRLVRAGPAVAICAVGPLARTGQPFARSDATRCPPRPRRFTHPPLPPTTHPARTNACARIHTACACAITNTGLPSLALHAHTLLGTRLPPIQGCFNGAIHPTNRLAAGRQQG